MTQFAQKILPLFESSSGDWLAIAREVATAIAKKNGSVTIDDVRELCPPPSGCDPRVMGAVLTRPFFVNTGVYRRSNRKECNGRPIAIFEAAR